MPILLTEAIDINTKMTDIGVQQPFDDKCVADCLLETKIDAKVEEVKKVASSGDAKQSARLTIAANNYDTTNETNEKEEIEHFILNNSMCINKCTEDKNSTLPISDKNPFETSVVEETSNNHIAIGGSVVKKTDDLNGAQISVEKHFENGEENKSAENFAKCISSQTNNISVRNELVDYQVPEDEPIEHEDVSSSETEIKDSENPQRSHYEKIILFEDELKKNGELLKPESIIISEFESFDKETSNKSAEAENKPSEVKPKEIGEISPSHTNNDSYNIQVESMERDLTSEMIANKIKRHENSSLETNFLVNKIKHKDTNSVTFAAEENSNTNKVNSIEQTCLSQAKSSLIVNDENGYILLEKNISEMVANGINGGEVLLPENDLMEQDPLPETDNIIVKNNVNNTIFQNNKQVSDNFSAKHSSDPNEEPMEQENTSQVDVVDSPMKESEIMKTETESPEGKNGDNVSESNETGNQSISTTDEITTSETDSENNTREVKNTSSEKLDGVIVTDSIEGQKQEQTIEEIHVADIFDNNCSGSIPKDINILTLKSTTEINKSSCTAEIDVEKKTNEIDPTESIKIEEIDEEHNDLEMPERPVEGLSKESYVMHKSEEISFKSRVSEDTNEIMEAEATKIENCIKDSNKKERNSAEQSNIPDQNEDTIVESSEKEIKISDDEFVLNYSDEECEVNLKDENKSPSTTEEILDTIIACMEVDRGGKKRVVETDDLDIVTINKMDIPQFPDVTTKRLCNLSNTLDILSDDDEQEPEKKIVDTTNVTESSQNSINIYDDDIMLIDGEPISKEGNAETLITKTKENNKIASASEETKEDAGEKGIETENEEIYKKDETDSHEEKKPDLVKPDAEIITLENPHISSKPVQNSEVISKLEKLKPLVPENFLKSFKNNVADMTRENIEELCLQLIVEGVVDRINLSEIKTKLKTMASSMDEWRKKTMILTKQNRDLQIVLKTVQEEQKKRSDGTIVPLKLTRSVGIQVYVQDNERGIKRKNPSQTMPKRITRNAPNPSPKQQQQKSNTQIPVPRLVPATCNSPAKNTRPSTPQVQNTTVTSNSGVKTPSPHSLPSGLKNSPPVKPVEKRPFSSVQSVTVDLTDDEPPPKQQVTARNAPQPPVRLVAQNQLLSARAQNQNNGTRKVYIPINSQNQAIRPGQTIMLKSVPPGVGPRPRNPTPMVTIPSNAPVRMPRHNGNHRHPAPLPDVPKQQQPPNWKALPPSPDLKISKVENGIVISWKIEGYQEDSYEQIAGYQLYAYQETASPPSTQLWKKIGDVKALPLPMACTLTQFMAGYKYFFAVRAIDVRSRIGPFSLPGSILLLNK